MLPGECRWLLNLDGYHESTLSIDFDYVDGYSDEEIVAMIRKGAKAAQLERAMWDVRQLIEDFEGHWNLLWTIEAFQAEHERQYAILYQNQNDPQVKALLNRFDLFWRGDFQEAGYVYCLSDQQGHYKLGRTKHLQTRIRALGTQPPFKIKLLFTHYVFDAALYEKILHRHFAHKRMNGEWFALDDKELELIETGNWANNYC
jgi:hypothetical protein